MLLFNIQYYYLIIKKKYKNKYIQWFDKKKISKHFVCSGLRKYFFLKKKITVRSNGVFGRIRHKLVPNLPI